VNDAKPSKNGSTHNLCKTVRRIYTDPQIDLTDSKDSEPARTIVLPQASTGTASRSGRQYLRVAARWTPSTDGTQFQLTCIQRLFRGLLTQRR
jgi:hypothetical protein